MKYLKSVYILAKGGEVIYHYGEKMKGEVQIFGGLMTAFNSMFENLLGDTITLCEGNQFRIHVIIKGKFRFIGLSIKTINSQKVKRELEKVANSFLVQFSSTQLSNYLNDISMFRSFEI